MKITIEKQYIQSLDVIQTSEQSTIHFRQFPTQLTQTYPLNIQVPFKRVSNASINQMLNSTHQDSNTRTTNQQMSLIMRESMRLRTMDKQNLPGWAYSTQKKSIKTRSGHKSNLHQSVSINQTLKKHLFRSFGQDNITQNSLPQSKFHQVINRKRKNSQKSLKQHTQPLKGSNTINEGQLSDGTINIQIDLRDSLKDQQVQDQPQLTTTASKVLGDEPREVSVKEQNVKVFVRLKPLLEGEKEEGGPWMEQLSQNTVKTDSSYYSFDRVFQESTSQSAIFEEVGAAMCQRLFEGYNGTIFAYGQTGSGKTYTIFGQQRQEDHGLIYRCIGSILNQATSLKDTPEIVFSMVELYKEQLIDMLGANSQLKLKEGKGGELRVEGLREMKVSSGQEMMAMVRRAAKSRKVAATKLNQESSRSHTLLTIQLKFGKHTTKLRLIDLAGSQKVWKSGAKGEAFQETKKINYSLSCLGNVINALTTRSKAEHVPFRDSKLTRLLKQSLTGNFMTSIIANCATCSQSASETVSSLKFAQRAKKIKVNVSNLEEQVAGKESINQLKAVIKQLKQDLQTTNKQLERYKEDQGKSKAKITLKKASKPKIEVGPQPQTKKDQVTVLQIQDVISDCDMTARQPIPSERAFVDQNIKRYCSQWHPCLQKQASHPLADFSSLNVSKSIPKFTDSPDLSSLEFKYDQSPDFSLSFSMQHSAGRGLSLDL